MAAAAALMSCSELVVVGEEPDEAATAAGAIRICCSMCRLMLLFLLLASATTRFTFVFHLTQSSLITFTLLLRFASAIGWVAIDDDGGCYPLTTKFKQQLKTKTKKITTTASCDGRDNDNIDDVGSAASSKPAFSMRSQNLEETLA